MSGTVRHLGIGVSGYGNALLHLPWRNEPSGAWEAIDRGVANGDVAAGLRIGHMWGERRRARAVIDAWMDGGSVQEQRGIMVVCVSWGAVNALALAEWFAKRHGRPARLFVMIEGVGRWGWPCTRLGPAEIQRNYHVGGFHWPTGATVKGAANSDLRDHPRYRAPATGGILAWQRRHVAGEWAGCASAIADIRAAAGGG